VCRGVRRAGYVVGGGYGAGKATTFRVGHMGDHTVDGSPAASAGARGAGRGHGR
jgi:aspartate aminotransferase-like enzyme